jgi:RNA polymerase sigma factor (sigma-70 family)
VKSREKLSQSLSGRGSSFVTMSTEWVVGTAGNEAGVADQAETNLETVFCAEYRRIARVIARVTRDPARAEELAVDVFLKWSRTPGAHGAHASGWLYRAAVRAGLNELRGEGRRSWYERLFAQPGGPSTRPRTPEEVHAVSEEQRQVRTVLASLAWRSAALLLLRSEGLSYAEMAGALSVNPASVGTLLARAQRAFRKEFVKRYGDA